MGGQDVNGKQGVVYNFLLLFCLSCSGSVTWDLILLAYLVMYL
jgi:hypothetical protein